MTSFGKRRFEARQGHFQANLFGLSFEAVKVCDSRIAIVALMMNTRDSVSSNVPSMG